ncbi:hypothetical protein Y1Q_0022393 [Alligator mississippiensis]|uniref:Uncharacterized protein n=1 Tax=Alligator mississippiensis TaxID=8496 RepID=A0A151P0Z7_ALLMI|nr:hypothetical protein Y1Q_0022393 [Alligator mississippiensis]
MRLLIHMLQVGHPYFKYVSGHNVGLLPSALGSPLCFCGTLHAPQHCSIHELPGTLRDGDLKRPVTELFKEDQQKKHSKMRMGNGSVLPAGLNEDEGPIVLRHLMKTL